MNLYQKDKLRKELGVARCRSDALGCCLLVTICTLKLYSIYFYILNFLSHRSCLVLDFLLVSPYFFWCIFAKVNSLHAKL